VAQVVLENIYKSFPASTRGSSAVNGLDVSKQSESNSAHSSFSDSARATTVLRAINLTIQDGEFMVLVGPSGCGKSTLLRLLAGLETATAGNIWVGDRRVNDLPPKERDIAMVFQNYALYPHMSVYDNLAFGLRRTQTGSRAASVFPLWLDELLLGATRKLPKGLRYQSSRERSVEQQVQTVAQMLQIEHLLDRLPKQLSGGQKQRVALGRAMARNPQVFLMDEPLSNLDAKLRTETRAQIVKLQRQLGTTTVYVTHDQTEAMTMGDRIAVLNAGQIQQMATPLELYNQPVNRFVAEFIGSPPMNFLPMQVERSLLLRHSHFSLSLPEHWGSRLQPYIGQPITLGIRPEHLSLGEAHAEHVPVHVELVEALGHETFLAVSLRDTDTMMQIRTDPAHSIQLGDALWLKVAIDKIHVFDAQSGKAV
jgi:multiple sugar transport system ATP-binding protein